MNEQIELEEFAPWLVALVTLVGVILRGFLLGDKGMSLDETFSVWLASHNISDMLRWMVQIDQHPPLYYYLLHYWIASRGEAPGAVRLLSALFGAGTIPVIYLIGKRMSGAMMGLAAAVLLAFSPFNIYFAHDARMYTLLAFNAAVAMYALVRLLTDPRSVRPIGSQFLDYLRAWRTPPPVKPEAEREFSYRDETRSSKGWRAWILRHRWLPIQAVETDLAWIVFVVFSAATMLSQNTAVLFVLGVNLFVLGLMLFQRIRKAGSPPAYQPPSLGNWAAAQIGIFLLWSPWLRPFIEQSSRVYQEFWVPATTWDGVLDTVKSFFFFTQSLPHLTDLATVIWVVYAAVLCLGLVHFWRKMPGFILLVVLFAVPILGELLVSIRRPIFLDRTLIPVTIPLFLALAAGIAQLRFRYLSFAVLACFAAVNLFSTSDYYKWGQPPEDWNSAARYVVAFAQKDDLVLFNATWVQIPFDYYVRTLNPESSQVVIFSQAVEHGVPVDLFDAGILEPKMTSGDVPRLLSLLRGHSRVWLVYSHDWYTDPTEIIPHTLSSQLPMIQQSDFYGVRVTLYGSP